MEVSTNSEPMTIDRPSTPPPIRLYPVIIEDSPSTPPPVRLDPVMIEDNLGFVRVGCKGKGEGNFYKGKRKTVPIESIIGHLEEYSLLIPNFFKDNDPQNGKLYLRYLGIADIDCDVKNGDDIMEGKKPFFSGFDAKKFENKAALKRHIKGMIGFNEKWTVEKYAEVCPLFSEAKKQAEYIRLLVCNEGFENYMFFSGCKGFRVFWYDPKLWVRVPFGEAYGNAIVSHLNEYFLGLEQKFDRNLLPPQLKEVKWSESWLDPSVYNHDMSVKPDIEMHPDTDFYPRMPGSTVPIAKREPEQEVIMAINNFWELLFKEQQKLYSSDDWETFPEMKVGVKQAGQPSSKTPCKPNSSNQTCQILLTAGDPEWKALQTAIDRLHPDCGEIKSVQKKYQDDGWGEPTPVYKVVYKGKYCWASNAVHGNQQSMLIFKPSETLPDCRNKACPALWYKNTKPRNRKSILNREEEKIVFPEFDLSPPIPLNDKRHKPAETQPEAKKARTEFLDPEYVVIKLKPVNIDEEEPMEAEETVPKVEKLEDWRKKNHYEVLNVKENAKSDEIRSAYKAVALKYHPDKHGNNPIYVEVFKMIQTACEILTNHSKRLKYDEELRKKRTFAIKEDIIKQALNRLFGNYYTAEDISSISPFGNNKWVIALKTPKCYLSKATHNGWLVEIEVTKKGFKICCKKKSCAVSVRSQQSFPFTSEEYDTIFTKESKQKDQPLEDLEDEEFLDLDQERFVIINFGKGKTFIVDTEFKDPDLGSVRLKEYTSSDISSLKKVSISVVNAWAKHPDTKVFWGVSLSPEKATPDGIYNIWRGFVVNPLPPHEPPTIPQAGPFGSIPEATWLEKYLYFEKHGICAGSEDKFKYYMGFKALGIQRPSKLPQKYIVLRGPEGCFKGLSVHNSYGKAFARHYRYMSAGQMNPSYNKFLEGVIVLFADEALYAGDKAGYQSFMTWVTNDQLYINPKGNDGHDVRNMLHCFQATNEQWIFPVSSGKKHVRRPVVFDVKPLVPEDHDFFAQYVDQLENGNLLAEILGYLKNWDLTNFNVRKTPLECLQANNEQKLRGMDPVYSWWHSVLVDGEISTGEALTGIICILQKDVPVTRRQMRDSFRKYGQRTQFVRDHDFWDTMRKLSPTAFTEFKNNDGRFHVLPGIKQLRKEFCEAMNVLMEDAFPDATFEEIASSIAENSNQPQQSAFQTNNEHQAFLVEDEMEKKKRLEKEKIEANVTIHLSILNSVYEMGRRKKGWTPSIPFMHAWQALEEGRDPQLYNDMLGVFAREKEAISKLEPKSTI